MAERSCLVQNSVLKFNVRLRSIETYERGTDHSKQLLKRILSAQNSFGLAPNIITETLMHRHWPLLFIIIPLVELYLIIKVGGYIGAFWTVMIVIGTAVIGVNLLRMQGFNTLKRAQQNMEQGAMPAMEMMEGIVLAVGGALLITPGFLTDTLGFICLIPFTRQALIRGFIKRNSVQMHGFQGHASYQSHSEIQQKQQGGRTIEGEFHRKDDE